MLVYVSFMKNKTVLSIITHIRWVWCWRLFYPSGYAMYNSRRYYSMFS